MKRRDTLTALGFLAALALALAVVVSSCFGGEGALETLLKQALRDRDVQAVLDGAERAVNQDLDRDHFFIQLFGGVQRLSGRRVVEDAVGENTVVKLSTGALNFVDLTGPDPAPQAAENAGATAALAQDLSERGIPYRFLLAPQKIGRDQALLPTGVTDRGNAAADAFLAGWRRRARPIPTCGRSLRKTGAMRTGSSVPTTTGSRRRLFLPGSI